MISTIQYQLVRRRVIEPAQQPYADIALDLAMKKKVLARLDEPKRKMRRYRLAAELLQFLRQL